MPLQKKLLREKSNSAINIFYSYSHKDEKLRERLEEHLALLRKQGLIGDWHDRKIMPSQEWENEINSHLNTAQVILLLISSSFLASDYCYDKEMTRAMERHEAGEARVIPIILRPCDWQSSPFAKLQSLPKDAKSVTDWNRQDEAFYNIAKGIRLVIEELKST
jgi:hypothetical protein